VPLRRALVPRLRPELDDRYRRARALPIGQDRVASADDVEEQVRRRPFGALRIEPRPEAL